MRTIILMPAYGARYDIYEQAIAAWEAGKDFRIQGTSSYCSIRDKARLCMHHDNIVLHALDGGTFVVRTLPKLDKLKGLI
jgi:hypothetical protein